MLLSDVFELFAQEAPVSVMVRATLENALNPLALDQLFEATAAPGPIESGDATDHENPATEFAAKTSQDFLLWRREVGGTEIG